jgi:hypothetical protein
VAAPDRSVINTLVLDDPLDLLVADREDVTALQRPSCRVELVDMADEGAVVVVAVGA